MKSTLEFHTEDPVIQVQLAQRGDREALARLCLAYAPLVEASVRRYKGMHSTWEDLLQIGYEQLIRGIYSFDEKRGVFLNHFLKLRVQGGILTEVRKLEKWRDHRATGTAQKDEEMLTLALDALADESAQAAFLEKEWQDLFVTLTAREKIAVQLTVIMDYRDRDLAEMFGVSKDTVKTWRKRGVQKLRKVYKEKVINKK